MSFRFILYIFLILFLFVASIFDLIAVDPAAAGGDDSVGAVMCNVYIFATGPIGKGTFVVIIVATSASFFMGKANVSSMIIICGASGCFFAAPKVAKVLLGGDDICPDKASVDVLGSR